MQAEINIGILGHVDHGKTTLTQALTGKWTDTHSEEIKRGISIRLGYADYNVYHNSQTGAYSLKEAKGFTFKRRISIVDAPGHETLMTTVLAASSILDGALFLIAANEECPMPQTREHLMVLNSTGIKNIVVVQTKVDLVSKEKALENYKQIKEFLKGSVAENSPIVPVSAHHKINIENLIGLIEKQVPTPARDLKAPLRIYISRSFDINKPGTELKELKGGIIGGSIMQGAVSVGDKVEMKPGIGKKGSKPNPVAFTIKSLREEKDSLEKAVSGGLIAIGTDIDPSLTKSDSLVGAVLGPVGELPDASAVIKVKYSLLKRSEENPLFRKGEPVVMSVHTATSVGVIADLAKGIATIQLKNPIVVDKGFKVAISRRFGQSWKLSASGITV